MQSKAYHSFKQKISYFDDDIELIDVIRTAVKSGDLTDPGTNRLLKHVDPVRHSHIARRRNSDGSRLNTLNHLRQTVFSSYVKDVYEEVTEYLRTIIKQASINGFSSGRIIGEHSFKMDASAVLALGTWEAVCDAVTDSVFQNLEAERSTLNLLTKTSTKLGLAIPAGLIDNALPYLEVRHALVHTNGHLSSDFVTKYPTVPRKSNGCIDLSFRLINDARIAIKSLIKAYDDEVVRKNLLSADDLQP